MHMVRQHRHTHTHTLPINARTHTRHACSAAAGQAPRWRDAGFAQWRRCATTETKDSQHTNMCTHTIHIVHSHACMHACMHVQARPAEAPRTDGAPREHTATQTLTDTHTHTHTHTHTLALHSAPRCCGCKGAQGCAETDRLPHVLHGAGMWRTAGGHTALES
jgi:hypothetical protein